MADHIRMTEECEHCGVVHERCHAHKKRTEKTVPCMVWPRPGLKVCKHHGGSNPQSIAKSERFKAEKALAADTQKFLAVEGNAGVTDPLTALERIVAQNLGLVQAAGARLNAQGDLSHEDLKGGLHAKVELGAYERGLDRAMKGMELLLRYRPNAASEATKSLLQSLSKQLTDLHQDDLDDMDWDAGVEIDEDDFL